MGALRLLIASHLGKWASLAAMLKADPWLQSYPVRQVGTDKVAMGVTRLLVALISKILKKIKSSSSYVVTEISSNQARHPADKHALLHILLKESEPHAVSEMESLRRRKVEVKLVAKIIGLHLHAVESFDIDWAKNTRPIL